MRPAHIGAFLAALAALAALAVAGCAARPSAPLKPIALASDSLGRQLEPLARAIGDSRIVLLGENGHGVGEFTKAKVRLVEWLHRELGFDVVVMESGFFECGHVWNRIDQISARAALHQCLRYPFQHAEILPLFELIRARHASARPLVLAGMDPQAQGYDSEQRPPVTFSILQPHDTELAQRIALLDSALFLPPDRGGQGDSIYAWVSQHGSAAGAAYDSAAAITDGWPRWVFRLSMGWIDRLMARAPAELAGNTETPVNYYQLRDEWMARAVAALADSIAGPRKVIVWLHNDHARYGDFEVGEQRVRSVGGFLREWYPDDIYSIGFFMGRGVIADNSRRQRQIAAIDSAGIESFLGSAGHDSNYLILRDHADAAVARWASGRRPYLRMGIQAASLIPADEFDALFYIDSVAPPTYRIPD